MINELINFDRFSRNEWQVLHQKSHPLLTEKELESLKSLNDTINIQDVVEVYLPIISLVQIYQNNANNLSFAKSIFLKRERQAQPFIIGISGSVAVGKSTTSRLIQLLLARTFKESKVELVTTDGFLYPNDTLIQNNLLNRKGFPESYDMEKLINFLDAVKNRIKTTLPIYSHEIYDIVPDCYQTIDSPNFLIVEGINVFQNPKNNNLYINDYFDFSIYIDADSSHIKNWYLERFKTLLALAKKDKHNYYHDYSQLPIEEAVAIAEKTWESINLVNLNNYILPTKNRADLIIHKSSDHKIDEIYLKR
ncbi:type I pantothenate kinase [uncultured Streptococcus sp.]|uniref:type I pantothenate kinase n=1 Tax=uncultured Streptococcus sp. TaxID=83427 RepID=UPI0027DD55EE|nr:type I pantothenate kinase [uncultured Streptococcus sp.]